MHLEICCTCRKHLDLCVMRDSSLSRLMHLQRPNTTVRNKKKRNTTYVQGCSFLRVTTRMEIFLLQNLLQLASGIS
jgi:hypothetical protein